MIVKHDRTKLHDALLALTAWHYNGNHDIWRNLGSGQRCILKPLLDSALFDDARAHTIGGLCKAQIKAYFQLRDKYKPQTLEEEATILLQAVGRPGFEEPEPPQRQVMTDYERSMAFRAKYYGPHNPSLEDLKDILLTETTDEFLDILAALNGCPRETTPKHGLYWLRQVQAILAATAEDWRDAALVQAGIMDRQGYRIK